MNRLTFIALKQIFFQDKEGNIRAQRPVFQEEKILRIQKVTENKEKRKSLVEKQPHPVNDRHSTKAVHTGWNLHVKEFCLMKDIQEIGTLRLKEARVYRLMPCGFPPLKVLVQNLQDQAFLKNFKKLSFFLLKKRKNRFKT